MAKTDKSKKKSANGGKRPGSGRKKGSETKATKEKREALAEYKRRTRKSIGKLFNAQMSLATGCSFLFCIKTKGKKRVTEKITSPVTIKKYLDGDLEGNKDEYYYISTEKPDNKAIDSLLDRSFGKSEQSVKVGPDADAKELLMTWFPPKPRTVEEWQEQMEKAKARVK